MIAWTWSRWRGPGVRPLEIWDRSLHGARLFELCGAERAAQLARAGIGENERAVRLAQPLAEVIAHLGPELGVRSVFAGGGLAESAALRREIEQRVSLPVVWAPNPRGVGIPGGLRILSGARGLVVDVGQTSIKLFDGTLAIAEWSAAGRAGDLDVLASAIAAARPLEQAMVLALPCELDAAGVPGQTSLPGWKGNRGLVDELLRRIEACCGADHPWQGRAVRASVLNDAELAAESARVAVPPELLPALVITLGFGPGAAVLTG